MEGDKIVPASVKTDNKRKSAILTSIKRKRENPTKFTPSMKQANADYLFLPPPPCKVEEKNRQTS